MAGIWTVLGADTNAARQATKDAGCTHAVINANWVSLQPSATGALDSTASAALVSAFDHAVSIGLKPIISINLHYAATWVLNTIEPFKDQAGTSYTVTDTGAGKAVRNWMWTQSGRNYVKDFITRVAQALGSSRVAATDGARLGGGWYGELHYPESVTSGQTYAWQGFGASMQQGTDLATTLTVCPLPGYVPYTGTDAQDCTWLNWYLNGIVNFGMWEVDLFKSLGFNRNLWLMLPGYGVRTNQTRTSNGYKQAAALGEDPIRAIGAMMREPAAWPYSTWLNTVDGFAGGTVDSDKAAWKSLYEKSLVRGKHYMLVGENTGNESNSGMDTIFTDAFGKNTYAGSFPAPAFRYYKGCAWLSYGDLTSGTKATMSNYSTRIAAANAAE